MASSHLHTRPSAWEGWPLLGTLSLLLLLLSAAVLALQPDVDGLRQLIRLTARTSLLLFLLAFTASAVARQWPAPWSAWQLRNRRSLGLGLAVSHGIHALAIVSFATLDPAGFAQASPGGMAGGYLAYVCLLLMSLTSPDTVRRRLPRQLWRSLHLAGMYILWISFIVTFGKRLPTSGAYALPLVLLLMAMVLRWWPRRQPRSA